MHWSKREEEGELKCIDNIQPKSLIRKNKKEKKWEGGPVSVIMCYLHILQSSVALAKRTSATPEVQRANTSFKKKKRKIFVNMIPKFPNC